MKELFRTYLVSNCFHAVVFFIWTLLVVAAFVASYDFMLGFGIKSYLDWWWILQVITITIYGFMTAYGFLGVLRTVSAISGLSQIEIKIDPYHSDGKGGLGFVGSFLTETAILFSSGSLFIPILLTIYNVKRGPAGTPILALIFIYSAAIAASVLVPIWSVHRKAEAEKDRELKAFRKATDEVRHRISLNPVITDLLLEANLRNHCRDIMLVNTWPFNTNNVMTTVTSVILPIILFMLQVRLSIDAGSQ